MILKKGKKMIDSSQWNEPAHPDDILPVGSALVDEGEAGVSSQANEPDQVGLGDAEVNTI